MPFSHLDTEAAPYIDEAHMEASLQRFEVYCQEAKLRGYTHLILGNLIHLVNFDGLSAELGPIYAKDSPYRLRHQRYKQAFKRACQSADKHGLKIVIETDFPAWTPPFVKWLGDQGLSLKNPRLWRAYKVAFAELFDELKIDAISVRIGEGGGAYNESNTGYASSVLVHTVEQTQSVLKELCDIIDGYNAQERVTAKKTLLFRTWTIGIGDIGALHTNPALYERVFKPFYGRKHLVTVIKHVAMDFFQYIPLNETIGTGELPQVVEFQARREYEGFGLFPNYRAASFKKEIRHFRQQSSFAGISVWPTNGGFLMPASQTYANSPYDDWIDQNVHAYGQLVQNPDLTVEHCVREWARLHALPKPDADILVKILPKTEEAVGIGLYIRPYAEKNFPLFGLDYFPTMLWLYWTRPVAAYGVQCLLDRKGRWDRARCISDGALAVERVESLLKDAEELTETAFKARFIKCLSYERSYFEVLKYYRQAWFSHFAWSLEGDAEAYAAWREALPKLKAAIAAHERDYGQDKTLPAMDCVELMRMIEDDERIPSVRWVALLLMLMQLGLVVGLLLSFRGSAERAPLKYLCVAVVAAVLQGLSVASLCVFQQGFAMFGLGFLLSFLLYGLLGLSLIAAQRLMATPSADAESSAETPMTAAVAVFLPAAVAMALATGMFAWGGPVWLYDSLIGAILGGTTRVFVLVLGALVLLSAAVGLWLSLRAALPESLGRRFGALALWSVLSLALLLGVARSAGVPGLLAFNRVARFAPTILGEAGTGVEDLVPTGGD